jgi:hypothetical protein
MLKHCKDNCDLKQILKSSGQEECYSVFCQERHLQSNAALSTRNFSKTWNKGNLVTQLSTKTQTP